MLLCQAENTCEVALTLEAAQCRFEWLIRTDLNFDHAEYALMNVLETSRASKDRYHGQAAERAREDT